MTQVLTSHPVAALFPDWFAAQQVDWPVKTTQLDFIMDPPEPDAPLEPALEEFMASGPPPILWTFGTGNIQSDPLFVNAAAKNLRVQFGSPVINAGNPASPLDADGTIAKQFGVPLNKGGEVRTKDADGQIVTLKRNFTAARWTFIIGPAGKILARRENVDPVKDAEEVLRLVTASK